MADFSENYGSFIKYNGVGEAKGLHTTARVVTTVQDGRLQITELNGSVLLDIEAAKLEVHPQSSGSRAFGRTSFDLDGHEHVVDFSMAYLVRSRQEAGPRGKLLAFSPFGSMRSIRIGTALRAEFVAALEAAGATLPDA